MVLLPIEVAPESVEHLFNLTLNVRTRVMGRLEHVLTNLGTLEKRCAISPHLAAHVLYEGMRGVRVDGRTAGGHTDPNRALESWPFTVPARLVRNVAFSVSRYALSDLPQFGTEILRGVAFGLPERAL